MKSQSIHKTLQSMAIFHEFQYSTQCHSLYYPYKQEFTPQKPRLAKPIQAITPEQVFFYYLKLTSTEIQNQFYSLSQPSQHKIESLFRQHSITSSDDAITVLTHIIKFL